MINEETRKKIKEEYLAITHFTHDWYEYFLDKYNIKTLDELLDYIDI